MGKDSEKKILDKLKEEMPYLSSEFNVKRLAIFGSAAKGTLHKNSDIDLFIEFQKPIGFRFLILSEYMEKILKRKVDILTPHGVDNIRVKEIADDIRRSLVYVS